MSHRTLILLLILVLATVFACRPASSAAPSTAIAKANAETPASPATQNEARTETTVSPTVTVHPRTETALLPCEVFPTDNIWNTPIDRLPVHRLSDAYIDTIGRDVEFHPDFGSGIWPPEDGGPIGIPYVIVPASQPTVPIDFYYPDESDPGPYPIPPNPPIEGGPNSDGDRHILVLQEETCMLYEVYDAHPREDGGWDAGSGAIYDLRSNALRPAGWTSADAAGLPILPGLVRYDEVAAGEITHALRFTAPETQRAFVWPARHFASDLTDKRFPPMGQRFRLRADYDISGFHPQIQIILQAMKRYGIILADNGSSWYVSGAPDERWDNDILHQLDRLTGDDFEAVDVSALMVDPDLGRAAVLDEALFLPMVNQELFN